MMTVTETLLDRFKTAVKFLIDNKIVGLQKDVAVKCEVSPNYLSGVLRDRIELKGKFLDKFVSELPINPSYILGISDEIYLHSKPQNQEGDQEGNQEPQKSDVFSHTEVIKLISKIKSNSTSATDKTKAAEQLNEIVAKLVDENSTLKANLSNNYQNNIE